MTKEVKTNETKGNGIMEVVFILDRSGSMSGMEEDTIGGFNSMLEKQRQEGDNVVWSTVLFDHEHEVIHNRVPIDQVAPLTGKEYYVRGSTALLDAIGRAINHIAMCHRYAKAGEVPEKTLFVITTDGMENSSREYMYDDVRRMIEREKEQYGWEVLFLGANIDAVSVAGRIGIAADRSATFINDSEGIRKNYEAFGTAMACMSRMESFDGAVLEEVRADYKRRSGKGADRKGAGGRRRK
ncbi:MAG: VWA domain-containing protein [Firmicutes bacterium]|nr:VWA domain-containing protein [Bacillota bacterium]